MEIIKGEDAVNASKWIDEAFQTARHSICLRAHCGAVIVKNGEIIGRGFNSPAGNDPKNRRCLAEYAIPEGFRHDRTCCVHAEQRAIQDALKNNREMAGADIYFSRADDAGNKLKSKDIKCTICSRAVLDAGISRFFLEFEDGIRAYGTKEFDDLSYEYKTPLAR